MSASERLVAQTVRLPHVCLAGAIQVTNASFDTASGLPITTCPVITLPGAVR